ncbi:MAG: hypothetical protein NVSMB68_11950 [Thermoanaerobaculia bacterium]
MRVLSRFALVVIVALGFSSPRLHADHLQADCPLTLVGNNPAASDFSLSPHGVFRSGSQVFVLRGQTLSTYNVTDTGDMQIAREDFIGSMGARESTGGVAFSNGYLYVSSEAGLEVFDLRNVRAGGTAPALVSRTPGVHYRRLAVNGTMLAGLYPSTDLPCYPTSSSFCFNTIDLFDVTNRNAPQMVGQISSATARSFLGFNDIAFNQGFLYATGEGGTVGFNISDPASPLGLGQTGVPGKFLASNGSNLLAVGNDREIAIYNVGLSGAISRFQIYTLPFETIDRANPLAFHPQAFIDEANGRIVTLVDEINPQTLKPARTIAIDVFDFTVPLYEGSDERIYENVSYTTPDEVKYNPVAVGPFVYVVGSMSGLQTYGACGQVAGRIEFDGTQSLNCGGAEIRGWVTGDQKIANVELFLDNGSLGTSSVNGVPRTDVSSRTPVYTFRVSVNLDATARGEHVLRAVGTDSAGNRRQFASQRVFFNGPGANCSNRRRSTGR